MNRSGEGGRGPVSVLVPFAGDAAGARETVAAMLRIRTGPGDELILADNSVDGCAAEAASGTAVRVAPARLERSSYFARNTAAEAASCEWLLFMDADCIPAAGILDAYFDPWPAADCGVLAGQVEPDTGQTALVPRYARERTHIRTEPLLESSYKPAGLTPNLMIRRKAFDAVGGFHEGLASGADVEICWRLQDARWTLEYRSGAVVEHRHVETMAALFRQCRRHASGRAWVNRRYPGSMPRPRLARRFVHALAGAVYRTLRLQFERALFRLIDARWYVSDSSGYLRGNRAKPFPDAAAAVSGDGDRTPLLFLCDAFPALSETFIASEARALRELGHKIRIESGERPVRPDRQVSRRFALSQLEDDGIAIKALLGAWLCARHPLRVLHDRRDCRRWAEQEGIWPLRSLAPMAWRIRRGGERHIHAHFAETAALNALRLGRLLGLPYSVTAHGYDIFKDPRNLAEKLRAAAFATTGCEYNARHLRGIAGPQAAAGIEVIVMGVDGERFRRRAPAPVGRHVVAVGRLVEKKGFADLIEAARLLRDRAPLDRLTIVGDGPLREQLERQVAAAALQGTVELPGWRDPDAVRDLLEGADLLAAPSVVAADGDRDSMPVVIKEALAMEVPVVGTSEVGIPEIVQEGWGRLVPPGDAEALAAAIEQLLALDPRERSEMGAAGRRAVVERADVVRESAKLSRLIESQGLRGG